MEPLKLKMVRLASQVSISGYSNTLTFKQVDLVADMDRGLLLIESRDGKEFIVPFANVCLMEVLDDAEVAKHKEDEKAKAAAQAELMKRKEAVLAQRAAQAAGRPAPAGVVKFVKDAQGNIVEQA